MDDAKPILFANAKEQEDPFSILDLAYVFVSNIRLLILGPVVVGVLTWLISLTLPPVYTARAIVLPPQQQSNSAMAALQSIGALAGLGAGVGGPKTTADQYIALMRSATMSDRILDAFKLPEVWETKVRQDARDALAARVRIAVGKKDGLMTVEVDDVEPGRAAAIANRYVEELRRLTNELSVTEAQQRRAFFERQLQQTNTKLIAAQRTLQGSGINEGALRAEPRAAAESYAGLKAQVTATEVRIQSLLRTATDEAPVVKQARADLAALRGQLKRAEAVNTDASAGDYIANYREFKYQETLFDMFAKQFELAKLDESRDAALIQVVDKATPPERKSRPVRLMIASFFAVGAAFILVAFVLLREAWHRAMRDDVNRAKAGRLKAVIGR